MRVQTLKAGLTDADILSLINASGNEYRRKVHLKNYYNGYHAINRKRGRENSEVNNKAVNNFAKYISDISVGFFIGQPVSYKTTAEHENELSLLLDIFRYNDEQAHNMNLAEESSITGAGYEILYLDNDAEIRMAALPSEEMILVTDATLEENIICAIRHYRVYDFNQVSYEEFVEVYGKADVKRYSYSGGSLRLLSSEANYFGEVPVIEYPNNRQRRGDFENVITLIDAYNLVQSLSLDDLEDFTDAFLVLKNVHLRDAEDAKHFRRNKIIELEEGGDAQWLIKNINNTYTENIKTRLQNDIHKFSNIPDMSDDSFSGNASGVAIKYKLIGLEQIRSRKEREFKKSLQRRIELIANVLRLKSQPAIDFRDVEMQFTANIPANVQELAQIVTSLDGVVSQKTLLGLLPFIENPAEEMDELTKENNPNEDSDFRLFDTGNIGSDTDIV